MPYYGFTRRNAQGNLMLLGDASLNTAIVTELVAELQKAQPGALVLVDVSGSINQIKHGQIQSTKVYYVRVPRSYYNALTTKPLLRDLRADDGIPQTVFSWVNNKFISQAGPLARVLAKSLPPSDVVPQQTQQPLPTIVVAAKPPGQAPGQSPGQSPWQPTYPGAAQSAFSAFTSSPSKLFLAGAAVLAVVLLVRHKKQTT